MRKECEAEKLSTRVGAFFVPRQPDLIGNSMRLYGEWAQNEINLISQFIEPGWTILDIGAYIGTHTRSFSDLVGEKGIVYAFEPNNDSFCLLEKNVAFSCFANIKCFNFGLSDESSTCIQSKSRDDTNKGANELKKASDVLEGVEVRTIDEWDPNINCSFMKVDVEGMEMKVLMGAKNVIHRCKPIIFLEANTIDGSHDILSWARINDYKCFASLSKAFNEKNFNQTNTNIFGLASECGVLLLPKEWSNVKALDFKSTGLFEIETVDDLVLTLLHKPQYPLEALAQGAPAGLLGIKYPSPLSTELKASNEELTAQQLELKNIAHSLKQELNEKQRRLCEVQEQLESSRSYIDRLESSKIFRFSRPLAKMKYAFDRWLRSEGHISKASTQSLTEPVPRPNTPIDIIVPVYRGLEDTKNCIESVLASTCQAKWHLVIINDCTPDPAITNWLRDLASNDRRIELLENTQNLGFVGTVNRGMRLNKDRDVLLLNSDAEVANDWLDRIQNAAYSQPNVSTVTPFSNNATICSYPKFCVANDLPAGWSVADLDSLCAKYLSGKSVAVPTGVGFCMFIRRESLNEIGLFDEVNFGKGYGEENDFCVRAEAVGWLHLHALDVFVKHAGGVSFGDSKSEREVQAMSTLSRLHPRYDSSVHRFITSDPAASARDTLDLARIADPRRPLIVMVAHNREGGTLRHIQEMAQHLAKRATFLMLRPFEGGVELSLVGRYEVWKLQFSRANAYVELVEFLRTINVSHIHFHHFLGHEHAILDLAADLGVSHDFTAHDYYSYCPQISLTNREDRYCGEIGLTQCTTCLLVTPAPGNIRIEDWRARYRPLLESSRFVIAPSHDTAMRVSKFAPKARIVVAPHEALNSQSLETQTPRVPLVRGTLKVLVLGALSRIKGADMLDQVASIAARNDFPVEFHLIGYAYRQLATHPRAALTVHGSYSDADLPELIRKLAPDVAWFPFQWPETYSYTLSSCIEVGLPIVATNLGAPVERLMGRTWSWVLDWQTSPEEWAQFFCDIRVSNFSRGIPPSPVTRSLLPEIHFPSFAYEEDYFKDLPPVREQLNLSVATTAITRARTRAGLRKDYSSGRKKLLSLLTMLKSSSALSWFTRKISSATQRKVKSWLLS